MEVVVDDSVVSTDDADATSLIIALANKEISLDQTTITMSER